MKRLKRGRCPGEWFEGGDFHRCGKPATHRLVVRHSVDQRTRRSLLVPRCALHASWAVRPLKIDYLYGSCMRVAVSAYRFRRIR